MKINKKIILTMLSILMLGTLTGEIDARRGGGGRGGRGGGARMGGARMAGRARMGGPRGGMRMARAGRMRGVGRRGYARGGRRYAHRGWRGGRWRGHRRGYGPWRRGYGWSPRWWGYGWGWPGVTVVNSDYYDDYAEQDYRDDMGYTYWHVRNSTSMPIEVRAIGGNYFRIFPGSSVQIPRGASFTIKVKASDGQRMKFATHNHFVEVLQGKRNTLRHRTWNE